MTGSDNLNDRIDALCTETASPGGTAYRSLSSASVKQIAEACAVPGRTVEIKALSRDIIPERYIRNRQTLSIEDQITLLESTVAVIGLGGLGGYAVEILARTGIGRLILVDGDRFDDSNLNRQLNSTADTLGRPKASSAVRRVASVNPSVEVFAHEVFLEDGNAVHLLADADLVIDCLDTLPARFLLETAALAKNIPMVTAAVAGTTAQVMAIQPGDTGLRGIYGAPSEAPERGVESTSGNLPYTVMMAAALECSEGVKMLLGPAATDTFLLVFDLRDNTFERILLDD